MKRQPQTGRKYFTHTHRHTYNMYYICVCVCNKCVIYQIDIFHHYKMYDIIYIIKFSIHKDLQINNKEKESRLEMGRRFVQTFRKKRHTNDQ